MRAESLGSLLIGRGHLTQEQLGLALTEQQATGRPLGEIIVALGFAAARTVAQALATQHGGLLKTEYGFATGWSSQAPNPISAPEDEASGLRTSLADHQEALKAWQQSHAKLEERLAQVEQQAPSVDATRVAQLESERDALKTELAEARKPTQPIDDPRLALLESDREMMRAALAAREESIQELETSVATLEAGRTELEQAFANEVERGTTTRAELAARDATIHQLKADVATLETARIELIQLHAAPAPRPAERWDGAGSHLVFFQGAKGYELAERSGPPPSEGSKVGEHIVARVASAPVPGSALPCAYLVR